VSDVQLRFLFGITTRCHVKWFCKWALDTACPAQLFQLPIKYIKALTTLQHCDSTDPKESVSFSEFAIQKQYSSWPSALSVTDPLFLPRDLQQSSDSTAGSQRIRLHRFSWTLQAQCCKSPQRTDRRLQLHEGDGTELLPNNRGQGAKRSPCSLILQQLWDTLHSSSSVSRYTARDVVSLREHLWLQPNPFCPLKKYCGTNPDLNYWGQRNLCNWHLNVHGSFPCSPFSLIQRCQCHKSCS